MMILLSSNVAAKTAKEALEADCTVYSDFVVDGYIDASKGISVGNGIIRALSNIDLKANRALLDEMTHRLEMMLTKGHKLYKVAPKIGADKVWSDMHSICLDANKNRYLPNGALK